MKTFVLLTACGLAMASGCQVSGDKDVDTTTRPPASSTPAQGSSSGSGAAPAPAPAPAYTMAYVATRDTEWVSSTDANATRGTLRQGDRVMFSRAPDASAGWQEARLPDGSARWVRPADFRAASK